MKFVKKVAAMTAGILISGIVLFPGGQALAATILRYGSRGSEVTSLQQALKTKGYFNATCTGYYGSITQNAVIRFQKDAGLAVDGIAGPKTLAAVYRNASGILKYGSRGQEVTRLQDALRSKGYFSGNSTGYYGSITTQAVKAFQRDAGLTVDGIAGPKTQAALYNSSASRSGTARPSATSEKAKADIYWLARIIEAEAKGEPYQGKVAVGNVIMNRVKSSKFPNSVYDVIFEYTNGVPQFSPVADGSIYNTPSAESMKAAEEAYNGARPVGNALYFFNPAKASGSWITKNRTYMTTIGGHAFYA